MAIKAVLIDFDGTLGNTNDVIIRSFQHTYRTFQGREEDENVIKSFFGEPLRLTLKNLFGENHMEEALNVYRTFQQSRADELVKPFPGMDELVIKLKKEGFKVAMVTSRIKDSAYHMIENFGILECFDHITTVNDITKHKPDPESIDVSLAALGMSADEAVMIGDSRFDILCAKNAGCRSILVDWSVACEEERKQLNADYLGMSADDIFDWIKRN